ncbi:hypothetical protein ONZ51_g11202 [Trametes cubensis]|uniref:Clathrin/coatomer adaptor adaptin-like N-terminal domain-containing protein n=1 Tax=Trametes cubensis TaxID=1111947 RepID=A0AAD7X602_9APHY|nr:hypothetical protein ONZ51_g11202 [Trametes cubensis]
MAGNFVREEILSAFIRLVAHTPELQAYTASKLYTALRSDISQESLTLAATWVIGEYSEILLEDGLVDEEQPKAVSCAVLLTYIVQEATINLIGHIADRGAEFVPAREWMLICFELLDLLKAHKKGIRRAAVNSFGYIAKILGPQDALQVLLTNLLVDAVSFVFEYVGQQSAYYADSVVMMLKDALADHRQTASTFVKHLALGVGLHASPHEPCLAQLLRDVHTSSARGYGSYRGCARHPRLGVLLSYTLQGLFHPVRKVREVYWRIYNSLYLGAADALVPSYPDLGG